MQLHFNESNYKLMQVSAIFEKACKICEHGGFSQSHAVTIIYVTRLSITPSYIQ